MYLSSDVGCFADGSLGHKHIRDVLAKELTTLYRHNAGGGDGLHWNKVANLVDALNGEPSDDAWEELEALDWLNRQCYDDTYFEFVDGDLMLVAIDEDE